MKKVTKVLITFLVILASTAYLNSDRSEKHIILKMCYLFYFLSIVNRLVLKKRFTSIFNVKGQFW